MNGDTRDPRREDTSALSRWVPWLGTVAVVALAWGVALLVDRSFFYFDDTPGGAVGQWYELGEHLWVGDLPFLNVEAWMAGNYSMEQWGLFNLPTLVIALLSTRVPDLLVFSALVKGAFLIVGALGVQYLARVLDIPPVWAMVAGMSSAVAGFTFFMDATTWVTQLMVWAWFGWTMAGLFRWERQSRIGGLVLALVCGSFVITVGYVHGTVFLVFGFIALLIAAALRRDGWGAGRTFAAGVVLGMVALAVYLPAFIAAPMTVRANTIDNDAFMTLTAGGLLASWTPLASPDLTGWWGRYGHAPYTYMAWFLPLVVLASPKLIGRVLRERREWVILGVLLLAFAMGPSQLAMFRYPVRTMPWLALVVLLLTVSVLARLGQEAPPPRGRAVAAALVMAGSYYLAWSGVPEQARWLVPLALVMTFLTWFSARLAITGRPAWLGRWGLGVFVALVSVAVLITQIAVVARRDFGFGKTGFPDDVAVMENTLVGGRGNALVVGDPWSIPADERWQETLTGNLWYVVDDADVMNLYSPSGFTAFNHDLCMDTYYGRTCQDLLLRLFAPDETTGVPLVDLLSVDTLQILADDARPVADLMALVVPDGWAEVHRGEVSRTWVRDSAPVEATVDAWESPGLEGLVLSGDDVSLTYRVDAVGAEGGMLVLPRLAWPGYTVAGATLDEPLRGYLLTVDVPAGTPTGTVIAIAFEPPGRSVQIIALSVASLVALGLIVGAAIVRRPGARGGSRVREPRSDTLA